MPVLTIIIPTWKRDKIFSETIAAAVEAVKNIDAEILIINDCGEDEVVFEHTKVKVYNNPGRGVSKARNSGASLAKSPILLFIDNDILITEENIVKTIQIHAAKERIILNASWVYPPAITSVIDNHQFGRILKLWKLDSYEKRYIFHNGGQWHNKLFKAKLPFAGFCFSIRKNDFLNFAMFNEKILFGGEEAGLSEKLTSNNIEYWIDPENIVYHNEFDRVFNYKKWLNKYPEVDYNKAKTNKQTINFFFVKIVYFMLDHFPNRPYLDKIYAKLLYVQSLFLKRIAANTNSQ